jgi:hypothetical protein
VRDTSSLVGADDDAIVFIHAAFRSFVIEEARLSSSIAHQNSSLLGALNKALVVTSDAIAYRDEAKLSFIKHVAEFRRDFEKIICQAVVVLLLLERVVESRVAEVLFTIRDEILLELEVNKNRAREMADKAFVPTQQVKQTYFGVVFPRKLASKDLLDCDAVRRLGLQAFGLSRRGGHRRKTSLVHFFLEFACALVLHLVGQSSTSVRKTSSAAGWRASFDKDGGNLGRGRKRRWGLSSNVEMSRAIKGY